MKTKVIITGFILVTFFVGLWFGSNHPKSSFFERINQNAYRGYAGDASVYLMALNAFRRGDEKGCANILENSLESSLFALNHGYKTLTKQPDSSIYETIKEARVYRSKYPWGQDNAKMTSDVEQTITAGVNHVLTLGK